VYDEHTPSEALEILTHIFCHLPLGLAAIEDINDNSILPQISGGEKKTTF
jgi:hypothetical protein